MSDWKWDGDRGERRLADRVLWVELLRGFGWIGAIQTRDSFESAKLTTGEFNEP